VNFLIQYLLTILLRPDLISYLRSISEHISCATQAVRLVSW